MRHKLSLLLASLLLILVACNRVQESPQPEQPTTAADPETKIDVEITPDEAIDDEEMMDAEMNSDERLNGQQGSDDEVTPALSNVKPASTSLALSTDESIESETFPPAKTVGVTPSATANAGQVATGATATITPLPSPTPAPQTATATITPPPSPTPLPSTSTPIQPEPTVPCPAVWFMHNPPDACPEAPALTSFAASQRFERGRMIWVEEIDTFYVFFNLGAHPYDGRLVFETLGPLVLAPGASVDNRVGEVPPPGLLEPVSGFGLIWRSEVEGLDIDLRQALGWAVEQEYGFQTKVQCQRGETYSARTCYLQDADGSAIVLAHNAIAGNVYWRWVKTDE